MKKDKPIWAENIKKRRLETGFESSEKFAEAIEMPHPTFRDIENGKSEGGFSKREKISKGLKWEVWDLYKDHSKVAEKHDFTDAVAFLKAYHDASPDIKKAVLAFLFLQESGKYLREISAEALSGLIRLLSSATKLK